MWYYRLMNKLFGFEYVLYDFENETVVTRIRAICGKNIVHIYYEGYRIIHDVHRKLRPVTMSYSELQEMIEASRKQEFGDLNEK